MYDADVIIAGAGPTGLMLAAVPVFSLKQDSVGTHAINRHFSCELVNTALTEKGRRTLWRARFGGVA
ncbi:MAG: hypothetical protein OEZ43_06890 [Gammaproteobacteria bacterium]|nr:hypothetical protein [Gammaproteobacteria bacterium]